MLKISSPVGYYHAHGLLEKYEQENLFDRVHLLHASNATQKKMLLEQADLFLMPSLDLETFGITVIGALAAGVPVVVSPVGALPEIIMPLERRLIAKSATAEAFSEVVVWYNRLSHTEKYKLRQRCIDHVLKNYTKKQIKPALLHVYQKVLSVTLTATPRSGRASQHFVLELSQK